MARKAERVTGLVEDRPLAEFSVIEQIQQMLLKGAASEIEPPYKEYADRPVEFCKEVLGVSHVTAEQVQILESVRDRQITNVQAGNSLGKSFISSCITFWWTFAVGGLCVSTAPTEGQLKEILWSEIRKMYQRVGEKVGGECGQLYMRHTEWARAYGFVAADYNANAFQGKHGAKLLLILEEACGISREIDEAAESCVTGSENRLLRIGNPIADGNPFAEACARSAIIVPSWGHPNVRWAYEIAPDGIHRLKPEVRQAVVKPEFQPYYVAIEEGRFEDALDLLPDDTSDSPVLPIAQWPAGLPGEPIPGAVSIAWIERQRVSKTEKSPFWQSRIEALFPEEVDASIIPRSWFRAARRRYDENPRYWDALASHFPDRYGLDVGDGHDDHARARWRGPVLYAVEERSTIGDREDVNRAGDWLADDLLQSPPGSAAAIDQTGVGSGAVGQTKRRLREASKENYYRIMGYSNGKKGKDIDPHYANQISQDMWRLREEIQNGTVAIAPLGAIEKRLEDEFAKTHWGTPNDQIKIEDKEITKKRLKGRSPDPRDAVTMGHAVAVIKPQDVGASVGGVRRSHQVIAGY